MCASLLPCPLCCQPHFGNLEKLRIGLIKAATENLTCPICNDVLMGLDKFTIHLFSHREIDSIDNRISGNIKNDSESNADSDSKMNILNMEPSNGVVNLARRPSKNVKSKAKNESSAKSNKSLDVSVKLPIYNMSALPFIGIPENISNENINAICNRTNMGDGNNFVNDVDTLSEKCEICGFYFLGRNILEMHKKLIHNLQGPDYPKEITKYPCHLCSKEFKMRGSLMVHLRMVHFGIVPSILPKQDAYQNVIHKNNTSTADSSTNKHINEELSCNTNLSRSPDGNHNDCKRSPTRGESEIQNSISNKQWECDICKKLFTTKYFLKKHKRLHTGEMPYSCNQCSKTFTFQQSYHKHLLYHNDDKPHACGQCGRSFKELSTLHNHQRIHTGEKPFSCESCGKCFRQRVSYLVHRRIHTGVMPYKCTACDKSFRYKVSQRTHKCTAQPPGMVVRQSGDLVQKLIKNNTETIDEINNCFYDNKTNATPGKCYEQEAVTRNEIEKTLDEVFSNNLRHKDGDCFSPATMIQHTLPPNKICSKEFMETVARSAIYSQSLDKCHNNVDGKNLIDEIVHESIMKMDLPNLDSYSSDNNMNDLYTMISTQHIDTENLPSPSDKLRDLKLSSPANDIIEDMFDDSVYYKHDDDPMIENNTSSVDIINKMISKDQQLYSNQQPSIFLFDKKFK